MCGCSSRATSRASASNRRTKSVESARSGRITLIATRRSVPGCVASYTRPWAPSPIGRGSCSPVAVDRGIALRSSSSASIDDSRSDRARGTGRDRSPRRVGYGMPGRPAAPRPGDRSRAAPASASRTGRSRSGCSDDEPLELRDRPVVMADRHQRGGALLDRGRPALSQSRRLRQCPPLIGELAERSTSPEREARVVARRARRPARPALRRRAGRRTRRRRRRCRRCRARSRTGVS